MHRYLHTAIYGLKCNMVIYFLLWTILKTKQQPKNKPKSII